MMEKPVAERILTDEEWSRIAPTFDLEECSCPRGFGFKGHGGIVSPSDRCPVDHFGGIS